MVIDLLAPFMDDLAARAQASLVSVGRGAGRIVAIAPGTTPAWDGGCDGYLYGRIVSITPGQNPGATPPNVRCSVHFWVATLAIAIIRCVGTVDNAGRPPLPARVDQDGRGFSLDAAALQEALLCSSFTRTIVQGVPLEEQGGYSGFEWTYTVRVPTCDCVE